MAVNECYLCTVSKAMPITKFKPNKRPNEVTIYLQMNSSVTRLKLLGSKFLIPKNESTLMGTGRLVKDHSQNRD